MSTRSRIMALVALLTIVLLVAVSCGAPSAQFVEKVVTPASAPAMPPPVAAAQPTAPAFPEPAGEERGAGAPDTDIVTPEPPVVPPGSPSNRKIIKDGELNLVVDEIVRAVDRATTIAATAGGYVLSTELSAQGDGRTATVKLGVPSEAFEDVMRQLRGTVLKVNWERASGSDVTAEYVDLQSQLTNLQATQARLREFLEQAETVEEALRVNAELSKIEGEIATIQGRLNFLSNRSAFSTITLYLEQIMPTPTITPTPSITPTPTATATATPIVWNPGETFEGARITLQYVLLWLGDAAIWAGVICVPLALIGIILLLPLMWLRRRTRRHARPVVGPVAPPANVTERKPEA